MRAAEACIIPVSVLKDTDLTPNAKLIYGELRRRCELSEDGSTMASNNTLAEFFGVSKNAISSNINALARKGYIKSVVKKEFLDEVYRYTLVRRIWTLV